MEKTRYYVELPPFTGRNVPVGEIKGNRKRRTVYPLRSSERNLFLWICDQTGKFIRVQLLLSRPESLGRNGLFQTGR